MTSGVVTRRLLTARLVILLIEMKALASTMMIDFLSFCIVEYRLLIELLYWLKGIKVGWGKK